MWKYNKKFILITLLIVFFWILLVMLTKNSKNDFISEEMKKELTQISQNNLETYINNLEDSFLKIKDKKYFSNYDCKSNVYLIWWWKKNIESFRINIFKDYIKKCDDLIKNNKIKNQS